MFKRVCIIGYGLIGSSLARVIRQGNLAETLICADTSLDVCHRVLDLDIADASTDDLAEGVAACDLVILAVPVGAYESVMEKIALALAPGAILTDVGSVKQAVIAAVGAHLPENVHFIPAHPIAGTEHSGPDAGFAELFVGRWSIITPLPHSDIQAVEKITKLWEACGARIEIMDPRRHDLVLAITSHLPHLLAYTIVGTATDLEEHTQDDVIKFSASGFRDFTRIAASDPVMWRDIFMNNREAVLEIVQRFTEDLTAMQRAIRWGDADQLQAMFTRTRDIRRKVIEAGQATDPQPSSTPTSQGAG
jgi:cyclohexadieny/prephenate dehydrogenase